MVGAGRFPKRPIPWRGLDAPGREGFEFLRISLSRNFSVAQALPTQELAEWRRNYFAGSQCYMKWRGGVVNDLGRNGAEGSQSSHHAAKCIVAVIGF